MVGPNGSGKSNISDAIRWVLGEQSAKSLRGNKMDDVIFQGGENSKSLNLAEVNLNFSNEDKALDLAYDKVKISRRIYRDGENEYRINGKKVRLKDVRELFLDTGVGKRDIQLYLKEESNKLYLLLQKIEEVYLRKPAVYLNTNLDEMKLTKNLRRLAKILR